MKYLSEIVKNFSELIETSFSEAEIDSICYDSRLAGAGSLFFAIRGEKFDSHDLIPDVVSKGCRAVVCERIPDRIDGVAYILVESTRKALAEASHYYFGFPTRDMKVIGVTGTNGKTTTTFIISQLLEKSGLKTGIIGTTGIYFAGRKIEATHTTPQSYELAKIFADMKLAGVECLIMEVSSHSLSQFRVFGIDFDIAIFSNLTLDHLDYHNDMQSYAEAKKILFDNLKDDACAIVNSDDSYSDYMLKGTSAKTKIKVGREDLADYRISNELISYDGSTFELKNNGNVYNLSTKLLGKFNIDNIAISIAAAVCLGMEILDLIQNLNEVQGAEGRMHSLKLSTSAVGIVDYSHTPDALEKALLTSKALLTGEGKLISVFGCGGDRDKSKRPKMGKISSEIADVTVVTDDNPRSEDAGTIREEILAGISDKSNVVEIAGRAEAIKYAVSLSKEGDIILVAGKGHEKYQIVGYQKFHFDDFEELKKC